MCVFVCMCICLCVRACVHPHVRTPARTNELSRTETHARTHTHAHTRMHNSTGLSLILQDLSVPDNALLVSIDVVSLYPSTPQSQCLDKIYKEMHTHSDLFTLDPNLLIRLLHIYINYNYIAFSHLFFQQIKETAMGATFSPTIANIFVYHIIRGFLRTQNIKPLVLTRYIDNIFLIWADTTQELTYFHSQLNSFHPNLRFTHENSSHTINFLDLTVIKGPYFSVTNIMDTKKYQKPLNLYQYLHFTSTHPSNVFKSIIRGECICYVASVPGLPLARFNYA